MELVFDIDVYEAARSSATRPPKLAQKKLKLAQKKLNADHRF